MITSKDLKLSCIGYRGYDDEWYRTSSYQTFLKIDNNHYHIKIWKRKTNNWGLMIYLCLTALNSDNILILEKSAKTMKELKQIAVDEINKYHNTNRCIYDIEQWKETHGKKVFDEKFNYLGVSYTNPERERHNSEFDYYNDEKPKVEYGTYYMVEEDKVMVCEIGYGWSSLSYDKSEELRNKLYSIKQFKNLN